ncbi:hypothetical protein WH52_06110 [Tenacibaculum holothuriorum]|uniref:Secretion system C-terminal sorting domain-containing protein n=1 Tax=Tenacibaculum holothuriorum TaxID=1635173 RepID=A0A1Y2PD24_9FLAO|nr:T9SS type A sorting domain-containing protein [Tenacibaculum holothuriorum]OSY88335.1 hypothetical protein WH52_06110 [Tenacibaculum holothuriorum]
MRKKYIVLFYLITLISSISFSQNQIGNDIDGKIPGASFGLPVSLNADGTIIAVGAHSISGDSTYKGKVTIYQYQSGEWLQLGNDINGQSSDAGFGSSISLNSNGDILAISCYSINNNGTFIGQVKIYQYKNNDWIQLGTDISVEDGNVNSFAPSVSINSDGNIIAIGDSDANVNGLVTGVLRVYKYQDTDWIQLGEDINGETNGDSFGYSVSLSSSGYIIAIGAVNNSDNGYSSGHVRVYKYENDSWIQLGNDIDGESQGDQSGNSISLNSNGSVVAIGAESNNDYSGHVRVFQFQSNNWVQLGNDIDGESLGDQLGSSVKLNSNGNILVVGAKSSDGNGENSGHVRAYKYENGNWLKIGNNINGEAAYDSSGRSISISSDGSIIAIGAGGNDDNGTNSGHVRIFDFSEVLSVNNYLSFNTSLYPNPAKDKVYIDLQFYQKTDLDNLHLYDILGKHIFSIKKTSSVDVSNLKAGIYFLSIETSFGKINKRLIVID